MGTQGAHPVLSMLTLRNSSTPVLADISLDSVTPQGKQNKAVECDFKTLGWSCHWPRLPLQSPGGGL